MQSKLLGVAPPLMRCVMGDTKYTVTDAAKETGTSSREASGAWHQARDDAQKAGELPERAVNKESKSESKDKSKR